MHLQKIKRARIGEKTQDGKRLRFVQQESVIKTRQLVSNQGNHKIELRPQKRPHDRHRIWPAPASQHQKDHADDDTAMRREKADESPIWKTKAQVWRQYRLQRSADSPETCDL